MFVLEMFLRDIPYTFCYSEFSLISDLNNAKVIVTTKKYQNNLISFVFYVYKYNIIEKKTIKYTQYRIPDRLET